MKYIKHGEFVRVDVSEYGVIKDIIAQIKRHVDGVDWVGEDCDSVTYEVRGAPHDQFACAVIDELLFEEDFPNEATVILDDARNDYEIGCSRIENDISDEPFKTDRTHYSSKSAFDIVKILAHQPYIHRFSDNMSEELKHAFEKLAEEIIKAKKIDPAALVAQA